MPSLWVERAAICPDGPSPAAGEGNGGAEPSAASGGCSEAEHRKAVGADAPAATFGAHLCAVRIWIFRPRKI